MVKIRLKIPAQELLPDGWVEWLAQRPPDVAELLIYLRFEDAVTGQIELQGDWNSTSSMLLISLPMWLWQLLPKRSAYQEIGVLRSANLLPASLMAPAAEWQHKQSVDRILIAPPLQIRDSHEHPIMPHRAKWLETATQSIRGSSILLAPFNQEPESWKKSPLPQH
ncbi:hypothetical protein LTR62_008251 [Meristemomyces frigidus]|uniref:Uncharacterized protein n=1 Tax=Meristemomyces frigidus TaxID=1508187 RepID=A0AAN7YCR9_9PEZI|nr:hypothetical protein LTR62_008251 [Meristemomyces frigidus]